MKLNNVSNWSVYIIRADDDSLYTGISTDVERRFLEHGKPAAAGAKYFNGRRPVEIVFQEDGHSRSSASRREYEIKRLNRQQKKRLIDGVEGVEVLADLRHTEHI